MSCPYYEQYIISQAFESPQQTPMEVECNAPDSGQFFSEEFTPTGSSAPPTLCSDESRAEPSIIAVEDVLVGQDALSTASDFDYEEVQTETLSPFGGPTDDAIDVEEAAFRQSYEELEDLDERQCREHSYDYLGNCEIAQPEDGQPPVLSWSTYLTMVYPLQREWLTPPQPYPEPAALRDMDPYIACRYDIPPDFPPAQNSE